MTTLFLSIAASIRSCRSQSRDRLFSLLPQSATVLRNDDLEATNTRDEEAVTPQPFTAVEATGSGDMPTGPDRQRPGRLSD